MLYGGIERDQGRNFLILGVILSSWGLGQLIETSLIFVAGYDKGKFSSREFEIRIF